MLNIYYWPEADELIIIQIGERIQVSAGDGWYDTEFPDEIIATAQRKCELLYTELL